MTAHAAEPGCQILWLFSMLAHHDGMPTDLYAGESCGEPVTHRVRVEREDVGQFLRLDANVCAPHRELAHHAEGFRGDWARKAVTT